MRWMRNLSAVFVALSLTLAGHASAEVVTAGGSDLRTGWYPESSSITPAVVSGGSFGRMWSANVEGSVYAQPLLANGTLLVATEENKVYGLDPATGALKWSKPLSLGNPWNPADIGCGDLTPWIGTTATPVIDSSTNTAYLTHKTYVSGTSGAARWYMDAVNMSTGTEQPGFPVELSGAAQDAPSRVFSPRTQQQRPGLLLMNGVVYAAFGSHCDALPWQGWIFGVSTAGKVTTRFVDNTTEEGGGIWQSGSGLASDEPGSILFATGNGGAPSKPAAGNAPPANLGESVVRVRVQPDGSLKPVDFFAPFNAPTLDTYDADTASSGVTVLPSEYFGTAAFPHLAIVDGKQGYLYLLNRDSLGGIAQGPGGSDNVIQRIGARGGVWSRAGVWPGEGGYIYMPTSSGSPEGGDLDVYKYGVSGSGTPSLSLAGTSEDAFGWGSGAPVITSDGTNAGSALVWIVWAANRTGAGGQLRAYDPVPVNGHPVERFMAPIGTASNYSVPGVGEGKLYVGTREGKVLAFGAPVKPPLSGQALVFPATKLGSTRTKTLTLTANEELTLTSLSSSSSQFELGAPTPALPATLGAGQTISIPVTFAPTQTGLVGGTVTAKTGTGKEVQFALSGTGQAEHAQLVVSPPVVSFQATTIGDQRSETATLHNGGGETLTINKIELPSAPFSAEGAPKAGDTIAPGGSLTVTIVFAPTSAGEFGGTLALETTGGNGQVGLSGIAGTPGALELSSEMVEYGSLLLGTSSTKSFTITNTGGTAVPITKSKPPIGGEFEAQTLLQEGTTIQAGETVTEQVKFVPTEVGPASGEWSINGEDTTGLHRVMFKGTGTKPPEEPHEEPPLQPPPGELVTHTPSTGTGSTSTTSASGTATAVGQGVLSSHEAATGPDVTIANPSLRAGPHGTVSVAVHCPTGESLCAGIIQLQARVTRTLRSGARSTTLATLASGSFTLHGGQARKVTLWLSGRARALLRTARVLRGTAIVSAHDQSGVTHTGRTAVTIRAARSAG